MDTLFNSNFTTDDRELEKILDSPEITCFLERLWQQHALYLKEGNEFRNDLKTQPHTRIWEMYLSNALNDCGFSIIPKNEEGPDIKLGGNPPIWIEAVTSNDGNKRIGKGIQPASNTPEILLSESMIGGPPEQDVILRVTTSIDEKRKKLNGYTDKKGKYHKGYIEKGIVKKNDPYIIALNDYKVSFSQYDHQLTPNHIPTIVKVMFAYGDCVLLSFYPNDMFSPPLVSKNFDYKYRPHIIKHSGEEVAVGMFFKENYSNISALVFSKEGFWNWRNRVPSILSENFILIHNPFANNPIPRKWLRNGQEFWIENNRLYECRWENGNEDSFQSFPLPYDLPSEVRTRLQ